MREEEEKGILVLGRICQERVEQLQGWGKKWKFDIYWFDLLFEFFLMLFQKVNN